MAIGELAVGFGNIFTVLGISVFVFALILGMFSGAIPGMNGAMTVVLLIPITYVMEPTIGIMMLAVVYVGAVYAGSISAIMFRVPGAPEAIMTTLDGYPMNQNGELDLAISTAVFASAFGGIVGTIILILFSPVLADWAIELSDPEFFAVILLALALVSTIGSGNITKSMIMVGAGLFVGTIGLDPLTANPRFTFGNSMLMSGINFIPVILGLFAVSEVFKTIRSGERMIASDQETLGDRGSGGSSLLPPLRYLKRFPRILAVNSVLGTFIGILPGAGATTGALFGYTFGQRISPKEIREKFGTGIPEGVAAPETANNAASSGAFVPLLTLGIPGSATTAVVLAAFILHGIRPGPGLLQTQSELVYTIFAALLLANVAILFANRFIVRSFALVRNVPQPLLLALIMMFSAIGAYATRNIVFDLWVMFLSGIVGYYLDRYNYPIAPLIIGLVLGPLAEPSLRRAIIKSQGDFGVFFDRPISAVLVVLAVLVFTIPLLQDSDVLNRSGGRLLGTGGDDHE